MSTVDTIAAEALDILGSGRQVPPFTASIAPGLDLDAAYRVTAAVRALREARGERVVGRKIGFTNRTIWAEYGVYAPIWGYVWDTTVTDLADTPVLPLAGLAEPRFEPEIMFGIGRAPRVGMDEEQLIGCLDWVAHGFEIVQSIFPNWKFAAADTVAAYGLHGRLVVGPRVPLAPGTDWLRALSGFRVELYRDGVLQDTGHARNVLDGPVSALRHLVGLLAQDPHNPPLAAGEIVSTGTLTRALPVAPGEEWSTRLDGVPLEGVKVRFA
ncbi:2-keto-4-pentenoate hydratase [Prosthecomicrobium sp. N25]|uniref:2-keto-4-pentenoate hydratase n=1 Tax=Prosthecomicrobium sp. N25 TaxID=3129254 RepID=UPI003077784D